MYFGVSRLFFDRCAVISGLGVSPTSIWCFRPCAAQNTMLAIFVALVRSFLPAVSLYLAGFRCSVSEFGAMRLIISAALVGGHTRSRSCVMLSIIIGVNILNWYGAVIAQSGRQFGESGG